AEVSAGHAARRWYEGPTARLEVEADTENRAVQHHVVLEAPGGIVVLRIEAKRAIGEHEPDEVTDAVLDGTGRAPGDVGTQVKPADVGSAVEEPGRRQLRPKSGTENRIDRVARVFE